MAGSTGFEPATSGLTVQCANQAAPRARMYFSRAWRTSVDHTMAQRARQLPGHILPSDIRRSPTEVGAMRRRLRADAPRPPSARGLPAPAATIVLEMSGTSRRGERVHARAGLHVARRPYRGGRGLEEGGGLVDAMRRG